MKCEELIHKLFNREVVEYLQKVFFIKFHPMLVEQIN